MVVEEIGKTLLGRLGKRVPMRRLGKMRKVALMVRFLQIIEIARHTMAFARVRSPLLMFLNSPLIGCRNPWSWNLLDNTFLYGRVPLIIRKVLLSRSLEHLALILMDWICRRRYLFVDRNVRKRRNVAYVVHFDR